MTLFIEALSGVMDTALYIYSLPDFLQNIVVKKFFQSILYFALLS